MATAISDIENAEDTFQLIAVAVIVILVAYLVYKLFGAAGSAIDYVKQATAGPGGPIEPGKTLNECQAKAIANAVNRSRYTLKDDHKQVWFFCGDYYCINDDNLHDAQGGVLGRVGEYCIGPCPCTGIGAF